jgi:YidC/Oxa1 family membrane protein insertase
MDNIRLILLFTLAFIALMLYQAWNEDYGQKPPVPQTVQTGSAGGEAPVLPGPGEDTGEEIPAAPVVAGTKAAAATPEAAGTAAVSSDPKVMVKTDLLTVEIDTKGGNILHLLLDDYPVSLKQPDVKFELMRPTTPDLFIAQSGLIGTEKGDAPSHKAVYQAQQSSYTMADDQAKLQVDLVWSNDKGIKVTKRFIFTRGTYLVTVQHLVENGSDKSWSGREYRQLVRTQPDSGGGNALMAQAYVGGAIYSPEQKYEKINFGDMDEQKLDREVKGGWIAMLQHYFLGAWIPPAEETDHFYSKVFPGGRYALGAYTPAVTVAAGSSHNFSTGFVAGPKLQDELEEIAAGLELTADYGWLTVLAKPIFWLMKQIHSLIGNWGWSIILLTLLIKLAFYKLSETSYKSMANMRRMTPRITALKDRYGDDKQRLNQAMMEMYKKEKINPLGGCLPILVQIPVFIALYWVLLESVELRQAPFIFWIKDLALKDPYFVLPVIMGVSMFIQQRLNPAPPDPMQAKLMMALPFVFTIFFAFFPSGLVLYWVTNNVLSIAQQWYITQKIEKAAAAH